MSAVMTNGQNNEHQCLDVWHYIFYKKSHLSCVQSTLPHWVLMLHHWQNTQFRIYVSWIQHRQDNLLCVSDNVLWVTQCLFSIAQISTWHMSGINKREQ